MITTKEKFGDAGPPGGEKGEQERKMPVAHSE
jgi:hypothetical protein